MNENRILRCCSNKPTQKISYQSGAVYLVCRSCFSTKDYWSRGIVERREIEHD